MDVFNFEVFDIKNIDIVFFRFFFRQFLPKLKKKNLLNSKYNLIKLIYFCRK